MREHPRYLYGILLMVFLGCLSCTEENLIVVSGNEPPSVNGVPRIRIENYVNRVFIDLIGREPFEEEMEREVLALQQGQLSMDTRLALIQKLQTDTQPVTGDSSYTRSYHWQVYNQAKIQCIQGLSDEDILSLGKSSPESVQRHRALVDSRMQLERNEIFINEMYARMVLNRVYDRINMNSANFVLASFDNLLWRYPTDSEFNSGFEMIEKNKSALLFGRSGQNKGDYVRILTESREMFQGLIILTYQQLLSRRPTTEETAGLLEDFYGHKDIKLIQQHVMVSDEYANF